MSRPPTYEDDTKVQLCATGKSKLQENSDRKAIIQLLVNNGGVMDMGSIDAHFGFTIRGKVIALIRSGWLRIKR